MKSLALLAATLLLAAAAPFSANANSPTPAEVRIEQARTAIAANPTNADAHNALALALARRGRETSNHDWYAQADAAVQDSLRLAPDNLEARKIETWTSLGRHKFSRALEQARALNKRMPDDVLVYALLTDACIEMGEYEEAEGAAQWALDLRPGDIAALTRAAYLREILGDIQGAIDLMQSAFTKTPPSEVEDRAWILCQFANLELLRGAPDIAERALADALQLFPGYPYALGCMVKAHTANGRHDEAAAIARELAKTGHHGSNLHLLGEALARAGSEEEARAVFAEFEKLAVREAMASDNANRELVFYYADRAGKPAEALRFARLEFTRRPNLFARHALAWALHVHGQTAEAQAEMSRVLAIGVRDPVVFYHAGMIARKSGDAAAARNYFESSLALAPKSSVADLVKEQLGAQAH